jgi:hypothetical protein
MRVRRKQGGLTLIGFLIVLSMVIFVTFIGMKIVPIYMEYYSVISAMDSVAAVRGSANQSPAIIRRKITNQLYLNYASANVKPQHIKVSRRDGVYVRVVYEVRKPMIGNLDIVAKFDRSTRLAN